MVQKWSFLLLSLAVCFYACQKPKLPPVVLKDANYDKAVSFLDLRNDSAYYYFNKVVSSSKDSLQVARAYNNMAVIQYGAGDYFGAQEMLTRSLKYLDEHNEKHYRCLASDYDELALSYMKLRNYNASLPLYDSAYKYSASEEAKRISLNNKALTLGNKGEYTEALKIYQSILSKPVKSKREYARTLSNMAITRWRAEPTYQAAPVLHQALAIRKVEKDVRGLNASYLHLSDFYLHSHPDSALFYTKAMLSTATVLGTPDDRKDALRKLIVLNPANLYKVYFSTYQQISDSLQNARNTARNQFALIRYDSEKNKADNLKLQKDNADKQYQILKQRIFLYGVLMIFGLATFFLIRWFQKRKKRQELQSQEAVRETQRKASKKVHDTLANDIYRIMKNVQHDPALDRELLADDIDDVYQRARDLSYDLLTDEELFHEKLATRLKSFATDDTTVILVGNEEELWKKISAVHKFELKYILQELMVNMQKHSGANNVVVKFENPPGRCLISYTDDGIGFKKGQVFKNGLSNTGNRIKAMGGELIFGDSTGEGLEIQIAIPIA